MIVYFLIRDQQCQASEPNRREASSCYVIYLIGENFVNFNFCQSQFSWVIIFVSEQIEK